MPADLHVLHILPHAGGGAETHIDLLERLPGLRHRRVRLSSGRTPAAGAVSIPRRWPGILAAARRADVVHVHGDLPGMLSVPMLRCGPSVLTTHGLHFTRRSEGVLVRRRMRAALAAADVTVCTSAAERDELEPLDAGRLEVVHNGIDLPDPPAPELRAAARAELGLADDEVAALYLGQLEARKEPLLAVRAVRSARRDGTPLVLVVAGDGPQIEQVRVKGGNAARVLGFRDDPQRLLAAADVFVMPSRHEGLSFAVLEAMGHGLPCVVSDGPGNPEAVGDAGVVVPGGDADALSGALRRLATDPAARERLGAAARERAAREFSVAGFLARMGAVYGRLRAPGRVAAAAPASAPVA